MGKVTVLMFSSDDALIEVVHGVIRRYAHLRYQVIPLGDDAVSRASGDDVGLVVLDVARARDLTVTIDVLRGVAALGRPPSSLVLGACHQLGLARTLLNAGAVDFLVTPIDLGRLGRLLDALSVGRVVSEAVRPERRSGHDPDATTLATTRLLAQVRRIAPLDTTVLLAGETGTGKTRLARIIHELSNRRSEPFLAINCAALSPGLIESELFGHARGSFTGADREYLGKFVSAGRGTLLLDEVDSLPLTLQAKLLQAVEERVFEAVGGVQPKALEARLIVASNRKLELEVAAGRFRADLFYRFNVVSFTLPALRDQQGGIIAGLARTFLDDFTDGRPGEVHGFSPEAVSALEAYPWPGNIRELRNAVERAVAFCAGPYIELDDLPDHLRELAPAAARAPTPATTGAPSLTHIKEEAELARIVAVLGKNRNNRLRTAAELGISRETLYKKLHKYGILTSPC